MKLNSISSLVYLLVCFNSRLPLRKEEERPLGRNINYVLRPNRLSLKTSSNTTIPEAWITDPTTESWFSKSMFISTFSQLFSCMLTGISARELEFCTINLSCAVFESLSCFSWARANRISSSPSSFSPSKLPCVGPPFQWQEMRRRCYLHVNRSLSV